MDENCSGHYDGQVDGSEQEKKAHEAPPGGMALRFPKGAI